MTKYDDLIHGLKQGKVLPVYLFFGDEEFLIQECVDLIIAKTVDPGSRDFNFNTVYCKGTPGAEIVNLCQTLPFMAERRLVIAKEVDALKAADLEAVSAYLRDPSPATCLVMVANQPRFDKKAVISAVESHGAVTRFFALLDREMLPWIEGRVKARGLAIQREAAQFVWQTLGNDLQAVSNELEKVLIAVKDRRTITFEDVKAVVGNFREYTPFDLADAIGKKRREEAFLILTRLIQEGESPIGLVGSIAWNFRRLLQAKAMTDRGVGPDDAMKKLRPPVIFHQASSFKEQMRSRSLSDLKKAFEVLLEADRKLKSSGTSGRLILERTILRLCEA